MAYNSDRKKAMESYKQREIIGGLFCIINTVTGEKGPVKISRELTTEYGRLEFAKNTNICQEKEMKEQWNKYGCQAFEIHEIEQLKKKPEQSDKEYADDLKLLLELYKERQKRA